MNELQLFLMGYKPAYYDTLLSSLLSDNVDKLTQDYPYINKGVGLIPDTTTYIFFQNDSLKSAFERNIKGLNVGSPEFHRQLGLTLGYPPKAVEFFVKCSHDPDLSSYKVGMHYMGIPCNGSMYDLVENCFWLWDTYNVPDAHEVLHIRIGSRFHHVEHKDISKLEELQKLALSSIPVSAQ